MAFLLCVEFGGYGGMRILLYCVAHPLTGRYATKRKSSIALFLALFGSRFAVSLPAQVLEPLRP